MAEIRDAARVMALGVNGLEGIGARQGNELELLAMAAVDSPREITTHRPWLGLYVKLRRWLYREQRMTLDPILARQVALNRALVGEVIELRRQVARLEEREASRGGGTAGGGAVESGDGSYWPAAMDRPVGPAAEDE